MEILVLSIWLALWGLLCGVGLLFARLFGFNPRGTEDYLNSFWIGWCFLIFILQLWQLFFSVNIFIVIAVSLSGGLGLFCGRYGIVETLKKSPLFGWAVFFLILLMLFPIAQSTFLPSRNYGDAGLYGLQTIRWINQYPVLPGLANLHGRLAFNSTYFLYAAFLSATYGNFYRLANGLLYLGFLFQTGMGIVRIVRAREKIEFKWIFQTLLICPLLIIKNGIDFSLLSSDIPVYFIGILAVIQLSGLLTGKELANGLLRRRELFYIFSFCLAGITLKLTFLAMGVAIVAIACIAYKPDKSMLTRMGILTTVVVLPWIAHSVVMSGYPFYPLPLFPFPVEWRVPLASVKAQIFSIISYSRMPGVLNWSQAVEGYGWLASWLAKLLNFSFVTMILPLCLAALGLLGIFYARFINAKPVLRPKEYLFLLPPVINLFYWFFSAPAIRFSGATFFIIGMGSLAAGIYELTGGKKIFGMNIILAVYLFFCLSIFYSLPMLKKGTGFMGFYDDPKATVSQFITGSGLRVLVPVKDNKCYYCDLPCTPYFHANLSLRFPNALRSGFRIIPFDENNKTVGVSQEGIDR